MLDKAFREGTHRSCHPEATWARVAPWLSAMGITRVADITGLDTVGVPVFAVYRPNSRSVSVSQGKGTTLAAARVSGVMEAIEGYHAETIERPLLYASHEQLAPRYAIVDIDSLPKSRVRSFRSDAKRHWVTGVDISAEAEVLVPYDVVHTDFSLPLLPEAGCFMLNSNGLASGNDLTEALLHGACEVVERDANALFSATPIAARAPRRVDLSTIDDPQCQALIEHFEQAGLLVAVWDLTTDIGLASLRAELVDARAEPFRVLPPSSGTGCHPSRTIALSRALTEAAQGRLTLIAGNRDDLSRKAYTETNQTALCEATRQRILANTGSRQFSAVPHFDSPDLEADFEHVRDRLRSAGAGNVVAVDLTQARFGIPVVRVIISGLEGIAEAPDYFPGHRAQAQHRRGGYRA